MASGDRRWAPARKSGMTVLGKVPKPINLPSQRLENHGLDPTVEIVPKGTFTWGGRLPSATPQNAWVSSSGQSPYPDGHTGSPINARPSSGGNGTRPSSGGSGTRPSTADSDKSHEATSNPWGPNSRPSSSSGIYPSNQSSLAASRPRSAETRPGSSHLSRFAENITDNAIAWASTKVADKLGSASIRNDNFILSSGDFPTLGAEKTFEARGHSSQGRPSSGSDGHTIQETHDSSPSYGKEGAQSNNKNDNSWKPNNHPYVGVPPMNIDRWEGNMPHILPYPSVNLAPQQFEPWHGHPVHISEGNWYREAQPGGPYRPPGPPGSCPIEHFPYYSQFPLRPSNSQGVLPGSGSGAYLHKNLDSFNSHGSYDSSNSHAVKKTGVSPGGFLPQNLEPYGAHRPHDSYVMPAHPGIHFRPGAYGPPVAYDGFYRPPAIIHHSSEREVHTRDSIVQFAVNDKFHHQNDDNDARNCPAQPDLRDYSAHKDESDQAKGPRPTQYKVLLKQRESQPAYDAQEKRLHSEVQRSSHLDSENLQEAYLFKDNQQTNSKMDERVERLAGTQFVQTKKTLINTAVSSEGHSPCHAAMDAPQNKDTPAVHDQPKKHVPSTFAYCEQDRHPGNKKTTLIEKIEGLNNKARLVDSLNETEKSLYKEQAKNPMTVNVKASRSTQAVSTSETAPENQSLVGTLCAGRDGGLEDNKRKLSCNRRTISVQAEAQDLVTSALECSEGRKGNTRGQRKANGAGNHTNSRFRNQGDEESIATSGISSMITETTSTYRPDISLLEHDVSSQVLCEMQDSHHVENISGSSLAACSSDSGDSKAQRVKLKEIAAERARQLKKQEEERTREQKSKAFAKLEELNRRTSSQSSNPCLSSTMLPSNDVQSLNDGHVNTNKPDNLLREVASSLSTQDSVMMNPEVEIVTGKLEELTCHSTEEVLEASDSDIQHRPVAPRQFLPVSEDNINPEHAMQKNEPCSHNIGASKVRQFGYRRRQYMPQEKNTGDKEVPLQHAESPKNFTDGPSHSGSGLSSNEEPPSQYKWKNKSSRNKNKLDNASSIPSFTMYDGKSQEGHDAMGSDKTQPPASEFGSCAVHSCVSDSLERGSMESDTVASFVGSPPVKENLNARGNNNHWNNQSHKRTARNHQPARPADRLHSGDTVIWAPVKSTGRSLQGLNERSLEDSSNKNDIDSQNSLKTKRAEIERYVPKLVVKETPQYNSQEPLLSKNVEAHVITCDEPVSGAKGPETGKNSVMAGKLSIEENRPSRHGKPHASWRQRSSGGSPLVVHSNERSVSSELTKSVQAFSSEQPLPMLDRPAFPVSEGECSNSSNNVIPAESVSPVTAIKDQVPVSRGKKQNLKAHKPGGSSYSPAGSKDVKSASVDINGNPSEVFDSNVTNSRGSSRSENKNSNEVARPQWLPKSQTHLCNPRLENINDEIPKQTSPSAQFAKDHLSPQMDDFPKPLESKIAASTGRKSIHNDEYMIESRAPLGTPVDQRNSYKESKFPSSTSDVQSQQSFPAFRHQGQHRGRFNRGQEANYKTKDHGTKSDCEYQQISTLNYSADQSHFCDGTQSDFRSHGSRYRERGHNHTRRGSHLYGRGHSTVHVGDYYNKAE